MFVKDYNLTRSLEKTYCVRKCKRNEYREFDHSGTLNIRRKHLLAEDVNLTFFFFFSFCIQTAIPFLVFLILQQLASASWL